MNIRTLDPPQEDSSSHQAENGSSWVSVQESIINEKMPAYNGEREKVYGPTIELFFHELAHHEVKRRRMLDIAAGLVGSLIYYLLLPFLALLIKLTTRGSVFTEEECPCYRGFHFKRTVFNVVEWPEQPELVGRASVHIPRLTATGRFLRATRLDRLPLFPLVLSGKMSLVGPHTYPVRETTELNSTIAQFYKRYAVKPGIKSPSKYHNCLYPPASEAHLLKMVKDDLKYVQAPSVGKDLRILLGLG